MNSFLVFKNMFSDSVVKFDENDLKCFFGKDSLFYTNDLFSYSERVNDDLVSELKELKRKYPCSKIQKIALAFEVDENTSFVIFQKSLKCVVDILGDDVELFWGLNYTKDDENSSSVSIGILATIG